MIATPDVDLSVLAPMGFAAIGAMVVLLGEVVLSRAGTFLGRRVTDSYIGTVLAAVSVLALALSFTVSAVAFGSGETASFNPDNPMLQLDRFSSLMSALLALAAAMTIALSVVYLDEMGINHGEYYALLLLSVSGMMVLVAAIDFLAVFLGFELMSIPIYVLAGFDRVKLRSNESAIKYFVIGSFASALLLYGMALLYGATGSTAFADVQDLYDPSSSVALVGAGLVLVGFAFKVSSVPFHQWTPDVYEGAPVTITAFMSVAVKTAAFAALARLLAEAIGPITGSLNDVLWMLAALSMVVGNAMAVIQDNVKRMLAYSSIAHAGTLLVGLTAGGEEGYAAVVFYLLVYSFMNLGAFGVVVTLAHRGQDCEEIDGFAGLSETRPGLAALMTLFLLSLAGIPGTAGFIAKFNVFFAAVNAQMIWLPILVVLTSVVSIFYYLRIPVVMYMRDSDPETPRAKIATGEVLVLGLCAAAVLFFGVFPNGAALPGSGFELPALDWAHRAVQQFFGR
ncbi:MAG: NADH-quinone oxidoreductase subunit N [Myxococcota bacterium]